MTGRHIVGLLPDGPIVVICGPEDDAGAWRELLGPARCLAVALDVAPRDAPDRPLQGATDQLAWHHSLIADLDGPGWLAQQVNAFDPDGKATLILPDPLDPPFTGRRRQLGRRHAAWRLFENKTSVDTLWDTLGVARASAIVTDRLTDLRCLRSLLDDGAGVVCFRQPMDGSPTAGGDGLWWWRDGPPPTALADGGEGCRVKLMPLLEGIPIRLHGLVLADAVVAFPPMELVTLPRIDRGAFLCAGAVPTIKSAPALTARTERIGVGLRERLGYRGGFAVDGILTANGYLPTDLNARLTSAIQAVPAAARVPLHLVALLAREDIALDPAIVRRLIVDAFMTSRTYTLFGAATRCRRVEPDDTAVRWDGHRLVAAARSPVDGRLALTTSPRGWLLTATLTANRIPDHGLLGPLAPAVFRLSDELFGTDFGDLAPPFLSSGRALTFGPR